VTVGCGPLRVILQISVTKDFSETSSFRGTLPNGALRMTEPDHVFRLHFHVKGLGLSMQTISVVPHADQAIQVLQSVIPGALVTEAEDLGLRSAFSDEAFSRLIAEAERN
jgi:hypothetical protein